ncbi:hypothetical protein ACJX0J_031509, partial [Zea mays]
IHNNVVSNVNTFVWCHVAIFEYNEHIMLTKQSWAVGDTVSCMLLMRRIVQTISCEYSIFLLISREH